MAAIKFDVVEMRRVASRLEDIYEELTTAINKDSQNISEIASSVKNKTSMDVNAILKNYSESNIKENTKISQNLTSMREYLAQQIQNYERVHAETNARLEQLNALIEEGKTTV